MGQSLSEPKTEKETVNFDNGDYLVAVSGMQGWRPGILTVICFLWGDFMVACRNGRCMVGSVASQSH